MSGKFGDPYNTKAPSSSVFDGNLARNETSRATLWALWAYRIALVVARCKFLDSSRNLLGTLGLLDRSRCGALRILKVREVLCRDLDKEVFYRELAQRS